MAVAKLREAQMLRTRAQILGAARARFAEAGYESTTIRDIAAAAGVSVGSVHAHFVGKQELLRTCLHEDLARAVSTVWSTLEEDATLHDQLMHCARVLFGSYAKQPALSQVMLAHTLFPTASQPPDELIGPFLGRVAGLFEAAAARGELRLDAAHALEAAQVFFSLYLSTLIGGLGGGFGRRRSAAKRADLWCSHLDPLLRLSLSGLAASGRAAGGRRG